jgi:acetyl esterase/lipase
MSWQSRFLSFYLRSTVRSVFGRTRDIRTLRARLLKVDRLFPGTKGVLERELVEFEDFSGEWFRVPESREDRVILYLHGGAFCLPLLKLQLPFLQRLCRLTRARAFVPHYRLVPEHPFPAAPRDCYAAYQYLVSDGCDPKRLTILGDSAGGTLTLTTLMQARDAADPLPACAAMLSPATDLTLSGASFRSNERRDASFPAETVARHLAAYVPLDSAQARDPLASPLFGDYRGLPPLLFQVGSYELIADDSVRTARKAEEHGVEVDLQVWSRMQHVFQMHQWLPEAQQALAAIVAFSDARTSD